MSFWERVGLTWKYLERFVFFEWVFLNGFSIELKANKKFLKIYLIRNFFVVTFFYFFLLSLPFLACHPIDNGRTDIGCDNPLQCSRGDDTDDLEEIEPSKKFVCKVRSIVDLRASIGFELRTTRPFEATANPRQIAALERMY